MSDRVRQFEKRLYETLEALWYEGAWVTQIRLSPKDYADLQATLPPHSLRGRPVFSDPFFGYVPIVEDATLPRNTVLAWDDPTPTVEAP